MRQSIELKQQQVQQKIDYWWNGQPQRITLKLLPDEEVDILRWKVVVHRMGGGRIYGVVRGAGLTKQYNSLFYIVETEHGEIIHSAKLTVLEPPEPIPDLPVDEEACRRAAYPKISD